MCKSDMSPPQRTTRAIVQVCTLAAVAVEQRIHSMEAQLHDLVALHRAKERAKERELEDAKEELEIIHKRRAIAEAADAPIARVPVEVLGMIFEAAQIEYERGPGQGQRGDLYESDWDEQVTLLRSLSTVSQMWRQIAFGFPRLWRNVLFGFCDKSYFISEACLKRSRVTPIHVWTGTPENAADVDVMFKQLQCAGALARVRKLCLYTHTFSTPETEVLVTVELLNLESLSLDYCDLTGLSFRGLLVLLQRFTVLRYLRIAFSDFDENGLTHSLSDLAVTVPGLEHLHLIQQYSDKMQRFIPFISAAQPRHLLLGINSANGEKLSFVNHPARGLSNVQELILVRFLSQEALEILCHATEVTALHLIMWADRDCNAFFAALNDTSADKTISVPKLRIIAFDAFHATPTPIVRFVSERKCILPLRAVRLSGVCFGRLSKPELSKLSEDVEVEKWEVPDMSPFM